MNPKDVIRSLNPYQPGKSIEEVKKKYRLKKIVKLASNENPYGCSPYVESEWNRSFPKGHLYPDGYARDLRVKLSTHLGVQEENFIFGSGSDEIVQMLCRTFLEPGLNTVMAWPTFPQYRHHAKIEGAEIREVPTRDGCHDLDQMLEEIDQHTRIVWLCTPNNPTGRYINEHQLKDFLNRCPHHVLVVIDEAYYEYVTADDYPESIPLLETHKNIIILRTFSKAYGLAGLRIGYGIADPKIIQYLNAVRGPFNTTSLSQRAAILALEDQSFVRRSRNENKKNMQLLKQFCADHQLDYFDSEGNFLLIFLSKSGLEVSEQLLKHGFIVRPGELLGIERSIRVTIGSYEDMKEFQEKMLMCL
ncbi:histidinol-phosphate aminotransferase [Melghiribacillus thermohalophilus]|uniref:Histidinol-phosphate aminotransferase n=1 Tax=Melghiribacillus thermohalophilus TaxID=1324956 RepID=A0A4R3NED6_9BACI|nr:histidinol-phosphate transaminase [Melghiribacillus thermohalophilus]TCT25572.1 histidinol-phosphate aminotransferase [Melghiribacillus thermohalophilus]